MVTFLLAEATFPGRMNCLQVIDEIQATRSASSVSGLRFSLTIRFPAGNLRHDSGGTMAASRRSRFRAVGGGPFTGTCTIGAAAAGSGTAPKTRAACVAVAPSTSATVAHTPALSRRFMVWGTAVTESRRKRRPIDDSFMAELLARLAEGMWVA